MVATVSSLNMDSLINHYGITSRRTGLTALDPGDYVITRGGFLGKVENTRGVVAQHLDYLAVTINEGYPPILIHTSNRMNFGIAANREAIFDIIYVIPRSDWPSLYKCGGVEEARVHLNKFSDNPDMQTLIASKLSYAAVARHYNPAAPVPQIEEWHAKSRYQNPCDIEKLPYQTPKEAWQEIDRRAALLRQGRLPEPGLEPEPEPKPEPKPEPASFTFPMKSGSIERAKQDGFVQTITTHKIEGQMAFGECTVAVKANGGDVQVMSDGGFMSADDLAQMIHQLEKVRDVMDGG